jgi:hypothetical protein
MNIKEILAQYPKLPHKFLVQFAYDCAAYAKNKVKTKKYEGLLEVVRLWLEDKATTEDVKRYRDNAGAAAYSFHPIDASYAVINVLVNFECAPYYADYVVDCASCGVDGVIKDTKYKKYTLELQKRIDQLPEFEKILYS